MKLRVQGVGGVGGTVRMDAGCAGEGDGEEQRRSGQKGV